MSSNEITVNIVPFGKEEKIPMKIPADLDINDFKNMVAEECHQTPDKFRLIFRGKAITEGTIQSNQIEDGHTIFISNHLPHSSEEPDAPPPTESQRPRQPQIRVVHASAAPAEAFNHQQIKKLAKFQQELSAFLLKTNELQNKILESDGPLDLQQIEAYTTDLNQFIPTLFPNSFSIPNFSQELQGEEPGVQILGSISQQIGNFAQSLITQVLGQVGTNNEQPSQSTSQSNPTQGSSQNPGQNN